MSGRRPYNPDDYRSMYGRLRPIVYVKKQPRRSLREMLAVVESRTLSAETRFARALLGQWAA